MITTNKLCLRRTKKRSLLALFVGGALVALIGFSVSTENASTFACVFYGTLVAFFLGIQLVGFISSQTSYRDEVEQPKFDMLRNEESR